MANRTDPTARCIRGTNPQNLIEKIVRAKIYQTTYWKEECFGLTAATLVDKAMELDHVGGTFGGNRKPTPFLCLVEKMLQIQPDKDIVVEFIRNEDYKYVRALGAFYLRLTGTDTDVYHYLEHFYNDYRKLRIKKQDGRYSLTHVDEFIDELLTADYSCDIAMPRLKKRWHLESSGALEPRRSALEDDFEEDEEEKEEDEMDVDAGEDEKDQYRGERKRRDGHRYRDRDQDDRDYDWDCRRGRERERDRDYRDYERDRYRIREKDYGRERERGDVDRERRRRRSPSTSRSRSRDCKEREAEPRKRHARGSASPRREEDAENGGAEEPEKKKEKEKKKDDGTDHPDPEIAEANRLRAQLGLKPLRL